MALSDPVGRAVVGAFRNALGRGNKLPEKLSGADAALAHLLPDGAVLNQSTLIQSGVKQVKSLLLEGRKEEAETTLLKLLSYGDISPSGALGAEARVSDVLELARHAHSLSQMTSFEAGLRWSVELLRFNPARGYKQWLHERGGQVAPSEVERHSNAYMSVLRDADATASLALVTGHDELAKEALTIVRPRLQERPDELARHIQRLKGELTPAPKAQALPGEAVTGDKPVLQPGRGSTSGRTSKNALDFGVERAQRRLEGVKLASRQPLGERKALIAQIKSGKVPFLEGVQRLKERNPQHEAALGFLEACAKARPGNWREFDYNFVLDDNILSRPATGRRLLQIFNEFARPGDPALTEHFLNVMPEFRELETVRGTMLEKLKQLRASEPGTDFYASNLESPEAFLRFFSCCVDNRTLAHRWLIEQAKRERGAPGPRNQVGNKGLTQSVDKTALARIQFSYARWLAGKAQSVRYVEKNGVGKFEIQDLSGLVKSAETKIRQTHQIGPQTRLSWDVKYLPEGAASLTEDGDRRVAAALSGAIDNDAQIWQALDDIQAEIPSLLENGKPDEARALLRTAHGLPEAYWAEQTGDSVMQLLRVADTQGWQPERNDLFAHAVKLADSAERKQELAWLGRLMGLSDPSLPTTRDPAVGKQVIRQFLANSRKPPEDFKRVLNALGLNEGKEGEFWTVWHQNLKVPVEEQAESVVNHLFSYADTKAREGPYRALLNVLGPLQTDGREGFYVLLAGFDALETLAPKAHQGLIEAGKGGTIGIPQKMQILQRLNDGVPPGGDAVSELLWLANQTLETGSVPKEAAAALTRRLTPERQALAQFIAESEGYTVSELHREVLERLKQPLGPGATPLSELQWLALQVANDQDHLPSQRGGPAKAVLKLMKPHLSDSERLLAETAAEWKAEGNGNSVHQRVLKHLANKEPVSKNPMDALHWLYTDPWFLKTIADGDNHSLRRAIIQDFAAQAENAQASTLQRALVRNTSNTGLANNGAGLLQYLDVLNSASDFRGDVRAGLQALLSESLMSDRDGNKALEQVFWQALSEQVSPAERSLIRATREFLPKSDTMGRKLFTSISEGRFRNNSVPEALFGFFRKVPVQDNRDLQRTEAVRELQEAILEELKQHYKDVNDESALRVIAAVYKLPGMGYRETVSVLASALKILEQRS